MSPTKSYLYIYKQNLDIQSKREGARATKDNAKERTEDAQAAVEAAQKNAKGNALGQRK